LNKGFGLVGVLIGAGIIAILGGWYFLFLIKPCVPVDDLTDIVGEDTQTECPPGSPYWCEQNRSDDCLIDGVCIN